MEKYKDSIETLILLMTTLVTCIIWLRKRYKTNIKPVLNNIQSIPVILTKIENINKELSPNGGSSLRDKVNKISEKTFDISTSLDLISKTQSSLMYLDSTPIFKCDKDGYCIFVNQSWLTLTGLNDPIQAYGRGWFRTIDPNEKELVIEEWEQCIESQSVFDRIFTIYNSQTEKLIKVRCKSSYIYSNEQEIDSFIGILEII